MIETALSRSGTTAEGTLAVVSLPPSEMFRRASDAHADRAVEMGLLGYEITAQAFAQMADLCALLADVHGRIEAVRRFLR